MFAAGKQYAHIECDYTERMVLDVASMSGFRRGKFSSVHNWSTFLLTCI